MQQQYLSLESPLAIRSWSIRNDQAVLSYKLRTAEPAHAITLAHTHQLEAAIRNQPATWLWSHNRWKYTVAYDKILG